MPQGWLGSNRRCGAIDLEVFRRVGLGVDDIRNFELVGVVGNHRWLDAGIGISLQDLILHFQFPDVSSEVRRVGRSRG